MRKPAIDTSAMRRRLLDGHATGSEAKLVRFMAAADPVATSDARTFSFVFSDESVDRYGDVIKSAGWDLRNFNANPIALFGHDAETVENVIGRAKNVRVEAQKLVGDIEFMDGAINANAEVVRQMVAGGFLKTVSVGFAPIDYAPTKDKSRPGGLDFTRSELLEISVVPIPANPNALVQARAAGIDVDRFELLARAAEMTRTAKITVKGLYSVGTLAMILADLGWLQDSVAWEAEREGDGSPVPQALMDAMKTLGQVLIDMTAEEVAELVAGDDEDDLDGVIAMSGAEARSRLLRTLPRLDAGQTTAVLSVARNIAAGHTIRVKVAEAPFTLLRAGKAISAANEKKLRAAHDHLTCAAEAVMSVVEPPDDADPETGTGEDDPTDTEKAVAARVAAARARKAALLA